MIKLRNAQYCNLKLFLIFLVIYGHLIEPRIWQSGLLMIQYRWIYFFHMPLFGFLSGLFIKTAQDCQRQLARIFPLYLILQTLAVIFGNGEVKLLTPYWYLWYLLSNCIWLCPAWIWLHFDKKKYSIVFLFCAIAIGCTIGYIPLIGRRLSLSRSLVFLPYFWIGLLCDPTFHWKKLRPFGIAAFIAGAALIFWLGNDIPTKFLYHATAYGTLKNGPLLRLLCYLIGGLLGFSMLTFIPSKRFPFTKVGADTTPAYILHAPLVLYVRTLDIPWPWYLLITVAFLYFTHKCLRWHSNLHGITPEERRDHDWLIFKKSTKNTHSRSIGSYYL